MVDFTKLRSMIEPRGTAAKITAATGISSGNISDWLSGRSQPKAEALVKLADYFNCSVDYLLGRTENPEVNK